MTIRHFSLLLVVVAGLSATPPVEGQLLGEYGRCFLQVNKWPEPWICPDRQSVRAPMAVMAANGWRRQNMLTDLHFTDNNQLTEAGELLVRWILYEAPQTRRAIYVHRGTTAEDTAVRMAAVAMTAQRPPPVNQSLRFSKRASAMPAGRPARSKSSAADSTPRRPIPACPKMPAVVLAVVPAPVLAVLAPVAGLAGLVGLGASKLSSRTVNRILVHPTTGRSPANDRS